MKTQIDGDLVFYGTGSGHPDTDAPGIVFVHGAGFDHSVWVMPARYFARHGYRVFAPDLPAHGRSLGAPLGRIEDMADWLVKLIVQESAAPVALVGHSMGSLIVMNCAARYPELVSRVAMLGASSPMPVGAVLLDAAADNDHAAIDMANTWSHSTPGRLGAAQTPGLSNYNSGERWLERMAPGVYHADLAACHAFAGATDLGGKPGLLICGDADRMTPLRAGLAVAGSLHDVQTVVLQGCGHAMLSEQPNQVLDALAAFLR